MHFVHQVTHCQSDQQKYGSSIMSLCANWSIKKWDNKWGTDKFMTQCAHHGNIKKWTSMPTLRKQIQKLRLEILASFYNNISHGIFNTHKNVCYKFNEIPGKFLTKSKSLSVKWPDGSVSILFRARNEGFSIMPWPYSSSSWKCDMEMNIRKHHLYIFMYSSNVNNGLN